MDWDESLFVELRSERFEEDFDDCFPFVSSSLNDGQAANRTLEIIEIEPTAELPVCSGSLNDIATEVSVGKSFRRTTDFDVFEDLSDVVGSTEFQLRDSGAAYEISLDLFSIEDSSTHYVNLDSKYELTINTVGLPETNNLGIPTTLTLRVDSFIDSFALPNLPVQLNDGDQLNLELSVVDADLDEQLASLRLNGEVNQVVLAHEVIADKNLLLVYDVTMVFETIVGDELFEVRELSASALFNLNDAVVAEPVVPEPSISLGLLGGLGMWVFSTFRNRRSLRV